MTPDAILLTALRPYADCSDVQWQAVVKAVETAGGVRAVSGRPYAIIQKAAKKFSSRSEAARYAANQRWKNQQGGGTGGQTASGAAQTTGGAGQTATGSQGFNTSGVLREPARPVTQGKGKTRPPSEAPEGYESSLKTKPVSGLADEIRMEHRAQGKRVPAAAAPYVDAMSSMRSAKDRYGMDSGTSVLAYALSNLGTFKGPKAKAIKAEIKARIAGKEGPLED